MPLLLWIASDGNNHPWVARITGVGSYANGKYGLLLDYSPVTRTIEKQTSDAITYAFRFSADGIYESHDAEHGFRFLFVRGQSFRFVPSPFPSGPWWAYMRAHGLTYMDVIDNAYALLCDEYDLDTYALSQTRREVA